MRNTIKSALAASALAACTVAGIVAAAGTAYADTYQRDVQLQDLQDQGLDCLDSNFSGSLYVQPCNGGGYQRWNVLSYAPDVNHYYSRVQIQNVQTGRCLRVQYLAGYGFEGKTDSCDSQDYHDQWNMTWVGNTAGNPSNSVQFANVAPVGHAFCLDRGQAGHQNNMVFDLGYPHYWCTNPTNRWQIWSMVH